MKLLKPLVFCLFLSVPHLGFPQLEDEAGKALESFYKSSGTSGVSACIWVENKLDWKSALGKSCEDRDFEVDSKTRIASISKPITAVAIMRLVEAGKLDLDSSISRYIDLPNTEWVEITTRQLLNHSAGIGAYQGNSEIENQRNFKDLEEAMQVFSNRPLLFSPGEKYFYTTYGYVVLGRIIEEVSGMDYAQYIQENIFIPAGMKNSGVENFQSRGQQVCLYTKKGKKTKSAKANNLSNRLPGGGIYSTSEDLVLFGRALLDESLISKSTFNKMLVRGPETEGNPYALGWFLYGPPPYEELVIGHSGEQTGCSSQLMIIPKSKTVVVVLSNTSGVWREVVGLASEFIRISELSK
ncbi:MAG: serine hydrolase domain-containing protein [Luteibaculum sp.]